MRTVGVKVLKARLSEYLRAVRAGETVLITDREQVVAELCPPRRHQPRGDELLETLDALSEAAELSLPGPVKAADWKPRGLGLPAGSANHLLDELRADR
ncbi:MAG: type II toxin-antitoxin system prevent-host-death family antitoxin [Gemmatimonadota bacterium]